MGTVSRAHGRVFGEVLPANTLIEAGNLIGDYEVEIELEAVIDRRMMCDQVCVGL